MKPLGTILPSAASEAAGNRIYAHNLSQARAVAEKLGLFEKFSSHSDGLGHLIFTRANGDYCEVTAHNHHRLAKLGLPGLRWWRVDAQGRTWSAK